MPRPYSSIAATTSRKTRRRSLLPRSLSSRITTASLIAGRFDGTDLEPGLAPRFHFVETGGDLPRHHHLDVMRHLVDRFAIDDSTTLIHESTLMEFAAVINLIVRSNHS